MAETARRIPAPDVAPETKPFWEAAAAGRLLLKTCLTCRRPHYYPRPGCPFCGSAHTEWHEASGRGVIYSYSVMRRVSVPYAIAYVTLEEGVTMMTNIVNCDLTKLRIGQRVHVVFMPTDGGPPVPCFAPE